MSIGVLIIAIINISMVLFFIGMSIPLLKGQIHKNKWYGFRVGARTEEEWQLVNTYGAQRVIFWSKWLFAISALSLILYGISRITAISSAIIIAVIIVELFCGAIMPLIAVFQTAFYASDTLSGRQKNSR